MRSAGIAGLKGMLPVAPLPGDPSVRLVRPFLGVTRDMTERYLGALGVGFVVDSTNLGCDYTRNRVCAIVFCRLSELIFRERMRR